MISLRDGHLLDVLVAEREIDWDVVADERETLGWFKTPPSVEIIYLPDLVVKVLANEVIRERVRGERKMGGLKRYRQRKRHGTTEIGRVCIRSAVVAEFDRIAAQLQKPTPAMGTAEFKPAAD